MTTKDIKFKKECAGEYSYKGMTITKLENGRWVVNDDYDVQYDKLWHVKEAIAQGMVG